MPLVVNHEIQSGSDNLRTREQLKQDFAEGQYLTQEVFQGLIDSVALRGENTENSSQVGRYDISPLEQYIIAENTYDAGNGVQVNTNRNPMVMPNKHDLVNLDTWTIQQNHGRINRTILYCRGRFYDNGTPGRKLNVYIHQAVQFDGDCIQIYIPNFGRMVSFYFGTGTDSVNVYYLDNTQAHSQQYTLTDYGEIIADVETDPQAMTCSIHLYDTTDNYYTATATYYTANYNGTDATAYSDAAHTIAAQTEDYGSYPDPEGCYIDTTDPNGTIYIRLTDRINTLTPLGYYLMECLYVQDPYTDLPPGTYYYYDANNSQWLEKIEVSNIQASEGDIH